MNDLMKAGKNLLNHENGATAIEYALIASLVSIAIVGVLVTLGGNLSALFTSVSNNIHG